MVIAAYPEAIATFEEEFDFTDVVFAATTNQQNAEILAIETTLGINAQGSADSVADRLTAIEAITGVAVVISDDPQTITGAITFTGETVIENGSGTFDGELSGTFEGTITESTITESTMDATSVLNGTRFKSATGTQYINIQSTRPLEVDFNHGAGIASGIISSLEDGTYTFQLNAASPGDGTGAELRLFGGHGDDAVGLMIADLFTFGNNGNPYNIATSSSMLSGNVGVFATGVGLHNRINAGSSAQYIEDTSGSFGPIKASAFTVSSALAGKEDVQDYEDDALAHVIASKVVTFKRKAHSDYEVGFIAEDLLSSMDKVIVEAGEDDVDDDGNSRGQGINLMSLLAVHHRALQQLAAKVEALSA
jgi:hypothetical protein